MRVLAILPCLHNTESMEKQLEDIVSLFSLLLFFFYQEILHREKFHRAGLPSCSLEFVLQVLDNLS